MKKQNKLSIKVRDLEPLKDVIGGRIGSPLPPRRERQGETDPRDPRGGYGRHMIR